MIVLIVNMTLIRDLLNPLMKTVGLTLRSAYVNRTVPSDLVSQETDIMI